jgi:ATP-dependent DNA helicase RecQ
VELMLLDGGAVRTNLSFAVLPTQKATKLTDILSAIEANLPPEGASGAVVYCATRVGATERVAEFLKGQGLAADYFHAGSAPDRKRDVQEAFRTGQLRVIAATNAFGMGIDKPDIRLVVHGDIPGSLENYLQEAGRAGRDRAPANCVLLFSPEDVERQFSLSARSRLARHEIGAILKALRRMEKHKSGEVVATPGEIVREEKDQEFERDKTHRRHPREDRRGLAGGSDALSAARRTGCRCSRRRCASGRWMRRRRSWTGRRSRGSGARN